MGGISESVYKEHEEKNKMWEKWDIVSQSHLIISRHTLDYVCQVYCVL